MQQKKLIIGVFGFGCVGKGVYDLLSKDDRLASIKKIVVKTRDKIRHSNFSAFSFNPDDILNDDEINLVIELIDDAAAAFKIVSAAMKKGKAVISANKKMIAENFMELLHLQKKYNVPFLYEASCGASIPLIRNLEEYYKTSSLQSLEGIVNGSTNFILTKALEHKIPYQNALEEAQALGYAETDPTQDTEGYDAAYKLSILTAHAFGICIDSSAIFRIGINQLRETDFQYARREKLKIKLVAIACKDNEGKLYCMVVPKFIIQDHPLYHVDGVFNGVITKSINGDTQFFSGKGAGALPTASAVLSDISAIAHQYKYGYEKYYAGNIPPTKNDFFLKVMVSFPLEKKENIHSWFLAIEESFYNNESGYFTGIISFKNLRELKSLHKDISIILFDVWSEKVENHEIKNLELELQTI